ncbi:MAG: beta-ketoacyl-ACP synthase III [Desulfovibrio sp.]|uniref:beta-ketoacyl-ACP synthase III n=1 Tax=Desulfovibrio sp. 7SRBS1 TaxID=3378064 RepID=UPI003B3DD49A
MPVIEQSVIRGLGFHVPERILTNKDLEELVETSDEWITTRTGIKERHIAAEGEALSDIALQAAKKALADAHMEADDLTHIIVATCTPDSYCPNTACILEHKLGVSGKIAFDINAACTGFTYNLEMARSIIALRPDSVVLIIGGDILSSRTNWADRTTCVLFGDGAGAAVLTGASNDNGKGLKGRILDTILSSDGSIGDMLKFNGGGSSAPYSLGHVVTENHFISMQGREVFKHAIRNMVAVSQEILDRNKVSTDDVSLVITHQANLRIIESLGKKLGITDERVFVNLHKYGNTSAATIPIALAEAREQNRLTKDSLLLVAAFGGGFTWGSALVRFE